VHELCLLVLFKLEFLVMGTPSLCKKIQWGGFALSEEWRFHDLDFLISYLYQGRSSHRESPASCSECQGLHTHGLSFTL
jgi:hypothetical protein